MENVKIHHFVAQPQAIVEIHVVEVPVAIVIEEMVSVLTVLCVVVSMVGVIIPQNIVNARHHPQVLRLQVHHHLHQVHQQASHHHMTTVG